MTLVAMTDLARRARHAGSPTGIGAFNVIQLEHAEAIVAGAEAANRPVIMQVSENTAAYHRSLVPLALACLAVAEESSAEVVVHLDHATDAGLVRQAVALGVGSVMYDASAQPHASNVRSTREMTVEAHAAGVWVEAELGEIGGKDGVHAPGARTRPDEAATYVLETGVDALAVAVGSSHAMLTRDAELDHDLIAEIAAAVSVPLVLHGSSGVPDDGLRAAVDARDDQDQHRHPPQRVDGCGRPWGPARRAADRPPQVSRAGARSSGRRGRSPADPAGHLSLLTGAPTRQPRWQESRPT